MISTIDIYEISGLPVILLQSISLFTSLISLGSSRKKSFFIMEILKKNHRWYGGNYCFATLCCYNY